MACSLSRLHRVLVAGIDVAGRVSQMVRPGENRLDVLAVSGEVRHADRREDSTRHDPVHRRPRDGIHDSPCASVVYQSSALLQVVPPRIASGILDASRVTYPVKLDEKLRTASVIVLSRTRLERLIKEFNLYETELQSMTM